jgi:beta-glucosidase
MASPWLFIGPEALYWAPRHVAQIWNVNEIYVTENGCSSADVLTPDGHVYDTDRVMYLRNYIGKLSRAVSEGFPVRGYFLWSLMDNFEWAWGFSKRFGLVYVDYENQRRIPKDSARWFADVTRRNGLPKAT